MVAGAFARWTAREIAPLCASTRTRRAPQRSLFCPRPCACYVQPDPYRKSRAPEGGLLPRWLGDWLRLADLVQRRRIDRLACERVVVRPLISPQTSVVHHGGAPDGRRADGARR